MLLSTTPNIEGRRITSYHGIVTGEAIFGANVFRDLFAAVRDFVGGRSGGYERVLRDGRDAALQEMASQAQSMGANAVIGIDFDYQSLGTKGSMLMATVTGTAVTLE